MGARPYASRLGLAFALVMSCFLGATVLSQSIAWKIGALSGSLANNAMPSIEHLAAARTELRVIRPLAAQLATADPVRRRELIDDIKRSQREIDHELDAYLHLARYEGEESLQAEVAEAKSAVDQSLAAEASSSGAIERAADHAADVFFRDIEFNAQKGRAIGVEIGRLRRTALTLEVALDAVSVLFTGLAAVFAVRTVGRYSALLQRHNEVLAERADELEQFAGRVAHDISGPLAAGMLSLELVQRRADQNAAELTTRGLSSLKRAQRILEGLLSFARAGARPAPDAHARLDEVVPALLDELRGVATEAGVELSCEPLPARSVGCDRGILEVLVSNLVRNAIKYIGEGPDKRVTVRATPRDGAVRITVEDTGPGIPPELLGSIFTPFVRGPTQGQAGVGLGLATVRRICERHGGSAGVDSVVGRGSRFWIELPAA